MSTSNAAVSLEEYLDRFPDDAHERPEEFVVETEEQATWAARKLAKLRATIDERERIANAERARIDEWLAEATKAERQSAAYFEGLLRFYLETVHREDPKAAKSLKLPGGVTVKSRQAPATWEFDEAAFLEWAEENAPDLVKVPEPVPPSIDKAAAKKALRVPEEGGVPVFVHLGDGGEEYVEAVGVTVTPGTRTYSVAYD